MYSDTIKTSQFQGMAQIQFDFVLAPQPFDGLSGCMIDAVPGLGAGL